MGIGSAKKGARENPNQANLLDLIRREQIKRKNTDVQQTKDCQSDNIQSSISITLVFVNFGTQVEQNKYYSYLLIYI